MNKLALAAIVSLLITGCSASIDKDITLIKGETSIMEVVNTLGSPSESVNEGGKLRYDYNSSNTGRTVTTGILLGMFFYDNHVLKLCDAGKTNCKVFKAKDDEDAKSLRIYFEKGVVSDAVLIDL